VLEGCHRLFQFGGGDHERHLAGEGDRRIGRPVCCRRFFRSGQQVGHALFVAEFASARLVLDSVAAHLGRDGVEGGGHIITAGESGTYPYHHGQRRRHRSHPVPPGRAGGRGGGRARGGGLDRKSTRLNSSHVKISYAVFCLKKKKKRIRDDRIRAKP